MASGAVAFLLSFFLGQMRRRYSSCTASLKCYSWTPLSLFSFPSPSTRITLPAPHAATRARRFQCLNTGTFKPLCHRSVRARCVSLFGFTVLLLVADLVAKVVASSGACATSPVYACSSGVSSVTRRNCTTPSSSVFPRSTFSLNSRSRGFTLSRQERPEHHLFHPQFFTVQESRGEKGTNHRGFGMYLQAFVRCSSQPFSSHRYAGLGALGKTLFGSTFTPASVQKRRRRCTLRPPTRSHSVNGASTLDLKDEFPYQRGSANKEGSCGGGKEQDEMIYFDSAATSQKPRRVLDAIEEAYVHLNANVHRAAYARSAASTERMEGVRSQLAKFLNADRPEEIVFTSGATDGINLVANTWGEANIGEGDEIVLTIAEHHSNLVPWQLLARRKKAQLKFVELNRDYTLSVSSLVSNLSPRTKLVALSHTSNVLGSFNPYVHHVTKLIKQINSNIVVLLDATQSLSHHQTDVRKLQCDFLVGSGHKMYGPTGVGFLYGKYELLRNMPPWKGGGEMIEFVDLCESTYANPPARFEAGTPPFLQVIGLGAAVDFIEEVGWPAIYSHDARLQRALHEVLASRFPELRLFCPPSAGTAYAPELLSDACDFSKVKQHRWVQSDQSDGRSAVTANAVHRSAVAGATDEARNGAFASGIERIPSIPLISFAHPEIHAHDIAVFLDVCGGVCVRSGHHCCQPLHRHVLSVPSTCRASLALYNTVQEIDRFGEVLQTVLKTLGRQVNQPLSSRRAENLQSS
ncbi:SufS subfamily cysteine desulfurase [Toxoplasma gondii VAND]|uniref:cysteine desulfurase n=1 Tax=Toxoplasma gondii VAND TaxID=933077 RepID=A0A086PL73_TOXGO|nr:SufS subfamily cysteine desulfurase [Toxoplasma gondii VAND]